MAVDAINSAAQKTTDSKINAAAASSASMLDQNAFLKLLIAQLKNQDPTKPVDPTQYVSQLAQFSSVEQSIKTNALLSGLITATTLTQGEGMIGRTLSSADGSISGVVQSVRIVSDGATAILDNGKELPITAGITIT